MRREFFVNVQILRLIAASLVVIIHFQDLFPHTQSLNYIFRYGYAGVELFFVISGFIMVVTTASSECAIVLPQPDLQSCPLSGFAGLFLVFATVLVAPSFHE